MNKTLKTIIQNALKDYNNDDYYYRYPTQDQFIIYLQDLIKKDSPIENLEAFQIYLLTNHPWNQDCYKSTVADRCIIDIVLKSRTLLSNTNINTPCERDSDDREEEWYETSITAAVVRLINAQLLTQAQAKINFNAIIVNRGQHAIVIAAALIELDKNDLLTDTNRDAITASGGLRAGGIAAALIKLNENSLLTDANRAVIAVSTDPRIIANSLIQLNQRGLLTDANRAAILISNGKCSGYISSALIQLYESGLLTEANRDAITASGAQYASCIAEVVENLHRVNLLTQTNFNAITVSGEKYAQEIRRALGQLFQAGLLTQANFNVITVSGGESAKGIAETLTRLHRAYLRRTQDNFNAITVNGGKYAWTIACSLYHCSRLIGGVKVEKSQANFDAMAISGGQYADSIAPALCQLENIDLLTEANRTALTFGGGKYAQDILEILNKLIAAQLLNPENAQANFDKLNNYVIHAHAMQHGMSFLTYIIKNNQPITQALYDVLIAKSNDNIIEEEFDLFFDALQLATIDDEAVAVLEVDSEPATKQVDEHEKAPPDTSLDYRQIQEQIMTFCEYVGTYLREKNQTPGNIFSSFLSAFIPQLWEKTDTFLSALNSIFPKLFSHEFDSDDKYTTAKAIMHTLLEMMEKNDDKQASFSEQTVGKIRNVCYQGILDKFDLAASKTDDIVSGKNQNQQKTITAAVKPDIEEMKPNECIILLLSIIMNRFGRANFDLAWQALDDCEEKVPALKNWNYHFFSHDTKLMLAYPPSAISSIQP